MNQPAFPAGIPRRTMRSKRANAAALGSAIASLGLIPTQAASLPPESLARISSGGLLLLDHAGDLVQPPSPARRSSARPAAPGNPSSLRHPNVAPFISLGPDPATLPGAVRAQAEPHLARNPLNPDHLVAAFQDGRWTDGGAVGIGVSVSTNGGLTWTRRPLPGITTNSLGNFPRATDPVVAFDQHGAVYVNVLAGTQSDFSQTVLLMCRSTDGGVHFEPPTTVYQAPTANAFADKNWMAINRFPDSPNAGRLAVTFTLFSGSFTPILACTSDDAGATWSTAVPVTRLNANFQGSTPLFLPGGQLAVTYWNFGSSFANTNDDTIEVALSRDGGATFDAPVVVGRVTPFDTAGIRDGYFLPVAAADLTTGTLFVACQGLFGGSPRILFSRSTDRGASWSPLVPVNDSPAGTAVFNATIDVSPDGSTVVIVFADQRNESSPSLRADYYAAVSLDGGLTWQPNLRLSDAPVDTALAPLTGTGRMIGDYFGVVAPWTNGSFVAALIGTASGEPNPVAIRGAAAYPVHFDSWRTSRFSAADLQASGRAEPGADPDSDGFDNLREYAFTLEPLIADTIEARVRNDPGDGTVQLIHDTLADAADLKFRWESSTDLRHWVEAVPLRTRLAPQPGGWRQTLESTLPADVSLEAFRLKVERIQ